MGYDLSFINEKDEPHQKKNVVGYIVMEMKVVEEKIEKKVEQVEEKYEEVAGNFSLISQRVEDLEKKLLVSGNKNESKILPFSSVPVSTSPVPVTASTVSVKLSTYDGKTNWEKYTKHNSQ
ncbi:hypothetical protein TNCV_1817311 [Trichonephila clavipes]|nr:hypothetical protein TNCV_1817311 [Trichonephila clavipes]